MTISKYPISLGVSGACKGSKAEVNEVGCDNRPTHLQLRSNVRGKGEHALVAWCCECYILEGGEDCYFDPAEYYND
jgi:hypothetical protein